MFKVGQIFNKEGKEFCLLEIINYNNCVYGFFSIEDKKLDYIFYEIKQTEMGYNLNVVVDKNLNNILFSLVESSDEIE